MKLNHVHFQVRDLQAAVDWFGRILEVQPGFLNERIATFSLGAMTIIVDAASADAPGTLVFESDDCDADFQAVVDRGAVALEAPANKEWGVRTAYFRGPGALKCEIEAPLVNN
jgi:catechol 2,3-dioxygenase-like lactoylglutathione lyase family enzyme